MAHIVVPGDGVMKTGNSDPVCEKHVLRALGIARLKAGQNVVES